MNTLHPVQIYGQKVSGPKSWNTSYLSRNTLPEPGQKMNKQKQVEENKATAMIKTQEWRTTQLRKLSEYQMASWQWFWDLPD